MTTSETGTTPPLRRVLVVEDDLTSREFLRFALENSGWTVVVAADVAAAQHELLALGFAAFDCVVTDYQMPELTGLDLLAWLKDWNSCLATIILTGMGEKQLVAESLRGGAADFLEKPVDIQKLRTAILEASALTQRQRHTSAVHLSVKELGETQARLLAVHAADLPVRVDICFHPKLEAGGDFFSHFQPAPDQYCCLLTDVSGHDLQAAYLSAYFQGVVRGMLERGAPMPEVFTFFNRLLLEEWNGLKHSDAGTSTAVCALLLDFPRQTVKVITCGSPAPVYVAPEGRAEMLAESGGFPLGWFAEYTVSSVSHATTAGGAFFLWSDGLEDLAAQNGVSTLSMGFILQRARLNQRPPTEVAAAADDVLFAEVGLPAGTPEPARWQPLVFEGYHGGQAAEIDQLQARWSRSLQRAVPELTGNLLYDLLLASREAVLNALRHGCHDDPGQWATFQISYLPVEQSFRVWVDDPGAGHDFDLAAHERAVEMSSWHDGITAPGGAERLVEKHRGLILMKRLSRRLRFERHGAGIIMDFKPASPPEGPLIPLEPPAAPPLREKPAHTADARKPTTQFDAQHKVLAITIDGDLTSTRVKELMAELEPALAVPAGESAPWEIVALHLPTARMVDSMGLNLLVKIFKTAHQAGGRLQLVCPNANVHRTLMFTRLDRQMELIKG